MIAITAAGVIVADVAYIGANKIKLPDNVDKFLQASVTDQVVIGTLAGKLENFSTNNVKVKIKNNVE